MIFENIPESKINFDETRLAFLNACEAMLRDPQVPLQKKIVLMTATMTELDQIASAGGSKV